MPTLADYRQFEGINWETGPVRNILAYQGVRAPHTGQPLSEALLLGISGGLVAGYFVFEYQGMDPTVNFLTRNTFDPMETLLQRLGVARKTQQTTTPAMAAEHLQRALAAGQPALVWADVARLPYHVDKSYFGLTFPIVVYGWESEANLALVADRARVPLHVPADALAAARGSTASHRHRMATLSAPDLSRLPAAVAEGICTCLRMFLGDPPLKPLQGKFGFAAFTKWATLLTDGKDPKGWSKQFPRGGRLYTGLTSAYHYIHHLGTGGYGARGVYADFLDEAAVILARPALREAAAHYRALAGNWGEFLQALLPADVPLLAEARALLDERQELFLAHGLQSAGQRRAITDRLAGLKAQAAREFPLDEQGVRALRQGLQDRLLALEQGERAAVAALQAAME